MCIYLAQLEGVQTSSQSGRTKKKRTFLERQAHYGRYEYGDINQEN